MIYAKDIAEMLKSLKLGSESVQRVNKAMNDKAMNDTIRCIDTELCWKTSFLFLLFFCIIVISCRAPAALISFI